MLSRQDNTDGYPITFFNTHSNSIHTKKGIDFFDIQLQERGQSTHVSFSPIGRISVMKNILNVKVVEKKPKTFGITLKQTLVAYCIKMFIDYCTMTPVPLAEFTKILETQMVLISQILRNKDSTCFP